MDAFSEKSDEERIEGTVEKLSERYDKVMKVSERRRMETGDGYESDVRSNVSSSSRRSERRAFRARVETNTTSLTSKEENWGVEADTIQDKKSDEVYQAKIEQGPEGRSQYRDNENGFRKPRPMMDRRNGEKSETEDSRRAQSMDSETTIPTKSRYEYVNGVDGFPNPEYAGDDRAELLRKLDELKDQLSKSGDLVNKGKAKVPFDRRTAQRDSYDSDSWYQDSSSEMNRVPMQNPYPHPQFKRPLSQYQYPEPPPFMHRDQEMGGNGFYPHVHGYMDPSRSHMHRMGPHANYRVSSTHAYMPGPYMDDGMAYMDNMEPYPPNFTHHHHPSCSCYQCRHKRQAPAPILPTSYSDKYSNVPNDRGFNYHDNPSSFGSRDYSQRSHNAQSHARWPSDMSSEVGGFTRRPPPPRAHLPPAGKHYRPIAGGAPFLTCYTCFELLRVPQKALAKNDNRKEMRCGACSIVIVFAVSGNKLVVSSDEEPKINKSVEIDKRDVLSANGDKHLNQARVTFSSEDYDNSGYDFHSMDNKEAGQVPIAQARAYKSGEMKHRLSTSTYASEAEEDVESKKHSSSAGLSKEVKGAPPSSGSSLQDYFEYSNKFHRNGDGNRSGRSEYDKVLQNKITNQQFLKKETESEKHDKVLSNKNATNHQFLRKESSATEIDLSSNEYSNTGTTFDSAEASREGERLKGSRAAESFFGSMMKKNYRDSGRSNESFEQESASVTVNGHLISDRLIKKAEKLAGPIQPGHYW